MYHQQQHPQIPVSESDVAAMSHPHVAPNCPRCASTNTKFCYYNNYSLSQPRYFCKACRRYWTKGGSLRNVPVGGGCRKSRRSRSKAHRNTTPHPNNGVDSTHDNSSSSSSGQSSSGPDIDMAAVFARYVSQEAPKDDTCNIVGEQVVTWRDDDDLESFDYEMVVTDDFYWSTMAPLEDMDSSPLPDELLVSDASWSTCFDLAGYGDFYRP